MRMAEQRNKSQFNETNSENIKRIELQKGADMRDYTGLSKTRLCEIHKRIRDGFYFRTEIYEIIAAKVLKKLKVKK